MLELPALDGQYERENAEGARARARSEQED
jgi:hypothetical protein